MKNIYIKPATRVVAITNDFALLGQSEEDYSEFYSSRKSLFD